MIDLDALDASIAESEKKNFFVAPIVKELIAELRHARGERAAGVAWLRREMQPCSGPVRATLAWAANSVEEGAHRREEER